MNDLDQYFSTYGRIMRISQQIRVNAIDVMVQK